MSSPGAIRRRGDSGAPGGCLAEAPPATCAARVDGLRPGRLASARRLPTGEHPVGEGCHAVAPHDRRSEADPSHQHHSVSALVRYRLSGDLRMIQNRTARGKSPRDPAGPKDATRFGHQGIGRRFVYILRGEERPRTSLRRRRQRRRRAACVAQPRSGRDAPVITGRGD